MHKTFIYVLSEGQVLHAQGIHLCPVLSASSPMHKAFIYVLFLRTSSPCTRHSCMSCPEDMFSMHKVLVYILC